MKKGQLLEFLKPFTDEIDIVVLVKNDMGFADDEVDLEPVYKLAPNGEGRIYFIVDDET